MFGTSSVLPCTSVFGPNKRAKMSYFVEQRPSLPFGSVTHLGSPFQSAPVDSLKATMEKLEKIEELSQFGSDKPVDQPQPRPLFFSMVKSYSREAVISRARVAMEQHISKIHASFHQQVDEYERVDGEKQQMNTPYFKVDVTAFSEFVVSLVIEDLTKEGWTAYLDPMIVQDGENRAMLIIN